MAQALNRRRALAIAAACGLACAMQARADERSAGVPLPGLLSQPAGAVRAAASAVELDGDAVVLRLRLQAAAAPGALALRGPLFTWMGEADAYPDRHFPALRARLNGEPLPSGMAFEAFAGGHDITADLKALGLDPFVIATTPPVLDPVPAADSAPFKRLLARQAVQMTEGQPWARWQARRLWRFELKPTGANATQDFELAYLALPRLALLPLDGLARALPLSNYCVSEAQIRERLAAQGQASGQVVARSYAVAVGIDGRAPAQLTIKTSASLTVFCGANGRAAFGGQGPLAARADRGGVLRVLRLDRPG